MEKSETSRKPNRRPVPPEKAPSIAQIKAILAACRKNKKRKHEMLIAVGWNMALRVKELAGIEVGDFDWVDDTLLVRKGIAKNTFKDKQKLKNKTIPMNEPRFVENLRDYIREMRLEDDDFLFCHGDDRKPYARRRLHYMIEEAGEWGGYKGLRPHLLRHSRAKWLDSNKYPLKFIQTLLRHEHAKTTVDSYNRYSEEEISDIGRRGKKVGWD